MLYPSHNSLLSIAPMVSYTDRHFRYLMRLITRHCLLYTEMICAQAIVKGKTTQLLSFSSQEKPLILQIAGAEPKLLAKSARIAQDFGYTGLNLNFGCPSQHAREGGFGACLMEEPEKAADCFFALQSASPLPVSIKHRLGIGKTSSYEPLARFVSTLAEAGCAHFIVHARNALLCGVSPKKNRTIPELRHDFVYQLAHDFPHLRFDLNGAISNLKQAQSLLETKEKLSSVIEKTAADKTASSNKEQNKIGKQRAGAAKIQGIMIGRAAYAQPYLFALADQSFYASTNKVPSRYEIVKAFQAYIEQCTNPLDKRISIKHSLALFQAIPGARAWRQYLSNAAQEKDPSAAALEQALRFIPDSYLHLRGDAREKEKAKS